MARIRQVLCFALALLGTHAAAVSAAYPEKPIEMVVAGNPGGGLDLVGRSLESTLRETKLVTQPFVIKNMGGAGGNVAKAYTHQKKGDSHVLYVESNRVYLAKLVGTTQLGFTDLTPVSRLITEYLVWAVRADSPLKTSEDVFSKLKSSPTAVTFGVGTVPGNDQMNIVRPLIAKGIDPKAIKLVTFKAGGDLMIQLLGGHVDVISTGVSEALEQVKAGKVRLIAISAPQPLTGELAKVPTWRSMGVPVEILHWRGLFAPPGVSPDVVKFWNATLAKMVKTPEWQKVLDRHQWFDAYADSETFTRDLRQENEVYTKILTDLGMAKGAAQK